MHKRIVLSIVARILFVVSLAMTTALAWAASENRYSAETASFIVVILLGVLASWVFRLVFPLQSSDIEKLNAKDGLAVVGCSWIVLSLFGALPFYLSGALPCFTDAFFETISGFTTTGATVITQIEEFPQGLLFWRSLTHWLGGMGIIVLFLALLPAIGQGAYRLYQAEAPGPTAERLQPRIKETAKTLWGVYFLLSALQSLLLKAGGMSWFDAFCHTFGTMATGGFSTRSASIGAFSPYIQWIVIVFMVLAGTNFFLLYQALSGRIRSFWKSEEFRWYCFLLTGAVVFFAVVLHFSQGPQTSLRTIIFQVVSIMTTTGYTTTNFDLWPGVLRLSLLCLMFIGGCSGSTAGGLKVLRVFLIVKVMARSVIQAIFPNAIVLVKKDQKPVADKIILSVVSFVLLFIFLFILGVLVIMGTNRCDVPTAVSASIAALGNIGPGLGRVGASEHYAWVSLPGKWMLSFLMLAGRLELYAMLIFFAPATWRK